MDTNFNVNGFIVLENIISDEDIIEIEQNLTSLPNGEAGTRNLLSYEWCKQLSRTIASHPLICNLIPNPGAAIQCTYFTKSLNRNWLVPLHQDYVIPVKERFSAPNWSMWSIKEGTHYTRPPQKILENLVAVRIHLEANTAHNGPVQVISGSHVTGATSAPRTTCYVGKGGALVMKPLILHSSSKIVEGRRRVLHFLYGPANLPAPFEWANVVGLALNLNRQ